MPIAGTGYVTGNFHLKLDRVEAGVVKAVDGGAISADVVNEPVGPSNRDAASETIPSFATTSFDQ